MMSFIKKLTKKYIQKKENIYKFCDGSIIAIEEVNDEMFSKKLMGDGFAILPTNGEIFSPVSGTITTIFATKHAIGLKSKEGLEILIHMGLETVALNGEPFDIKVTENTEVTPETLLCKMNLEKIKEFDCENVVVMVITNMDIVDEIVLNDDKNKKCEKLLDLIETVKLK